MTILVKQTRTQYSSSDGSLALICAVSKEYTKGGQRWYWYAFHPHQKDVLQNADSAYIAFGCGSEELILLIPIEDFVQWLEGFNITQKEDRSYWHVHISYDGDNVLLVCKTGYDSVNLTEYILTQ